MQRKICRPLARYCHLICHISDKYVKICLIQQRTNNLWHTTSITMDTKNNNSIICEHVKLQQSQGAERQMQSDSKAVTLKTVTDSSGKNCRTPKAAVTTSSRANHTPSSLTSVSEVTPDWLSAAMKAGFVLFGQACVWLEDLILYTPLGLCSRGIFTDLFWV